MNDETKKEMFNFILSKVGMDSIGQVVFEQNNNIYPKIRKQSQWQSQLQ